MVLGRTGTGARGEALLTCRVIDSDNMSYLMRYTMAASAAEDLLFHTRSSPTAPGRMLWRALLLDFAIRSSIEITLQASVTLDKLVEQFATFTQRRGCGRSTEPPPEPLPQDSAIDHAAQHRPIGREIRNYPRPPDDPLSAGHLLSPLGP